MGGPPGTSLPPFPGPGGKPYEPPQPAAVGTAKPAGTLAHATMNWKTTVFGLIGAAALAAQGVQSNNWHDYLYAALTAVFGVLVKDFNK